MIELSNGKKMPQKVFGTHRIPDGDTVIKTIKEAIKIGYRHIDTAWSYENETGVGIAIKECIKEGIVKREDLFITTKLYTGRQSYQEALDCFYESLEKLGLEYVDLYLIHDVDRRNLDWKIKNIDSWRAMEKLYKEGKIKALGVSNYGVEHLEYLLSKAEIKPMVNQIEVSIQHQKRDVVEFCKKNNIAVSSWGVLFSGKILNNKALVNIAQKYKKHPAQIAIKWCLNKNIAALSGNMNKDHIKSNFEVDDINIFPEDMKILDGQDGGEFSHKFCSETMPIVYVPLNSHSSEKQKEYSPLTYERKIKLFNFLPLLKERKYRWNKTKWYLFGFIPLLKITKKDWKPKK